MMAITTSSSTSVNPRGAVFALLTIRGGVVRVETIASMTSSGPVQGLIREFASRRRANVRLTGGHSAMRDGRPLSQQGTPRPVGGLTPSEPIRLAQGTTLPIGGDDRRDPEQRHRRRLRNPLQ